MKNKNRWPRSIDCQIEAVFHSIRAVGSKKRENSSGVRSFGTWRVYLRESHRFAEFLRLKGRDNILNVGYVQKDMAEYLENRLNDYVRHGRSRQTMETILSAFGKFEVAVNHYIETHRPGQPTLYTEQIRKDFYAKSKKLLPKSSRHFDNRAYSDPIQLISAIPDGTFALQASLQYEGGLRAEGVGAASSRRLKNPLTEKGLLGVINDPVTCRRVGVVASVEKGGKLTHHYVSEETYQRLQEYISRNGQLESDYVNYLDAINQAAKVTNQHFSGRGSHALKHNFAQERNFQCAQHGLTHEQALQLTSLELSHFRLRETLGYTRGK